jgi:hypothetical protein
MENTAKHWYSCLSKDCNLQSNLAAQLWLSRPCQYQENEVCQGQVAAVFIPFSKLPHSSLFFMSLSITTLTFCGGTNFQVQAYWSSM